MREKAEKRRNDYLKAKKKKKIYDAKYAKNENEEKRGLFGKLRKGKIPGKYSPEEIENDLDVKDKLKKSDQVKVDEMESQLEEYFAYDYMITR